MQFSALGVTKPIGKTSHKRQSNELLVPAHQGRSKKLAGLHARTAAELIVRWGSTSPYRHFFQRLQQDFKDAVTLSFQDVERLDGVPLPTSARTSRSYWSGGQGAGTIGNAILAAGWRVGTVDIWAERASTALTLLDCS